MDQKRRESPLATADLLAREWTLFEAVESGRASSFHLIWEAAAPAVVVGRSTRVADHVNHVACSRDRIEVLRRVSGGGAVVLGPGCFNYAIVLSLVSHPVMADVGASFAFILHRIAESLDTAGLVVAAGTDLCLNGRKVSGNAQRRGRRAVLHHGTLLYDLDASLAARYLKEPVRQPAYRAGRSHAEFMGNLPGPRQTVALRLESALTAMCASGSVPLERDRGRAPTRSRQVS